MDVKTLDRFLKIANMMMDEHEGVRSQALHRCNVMLAEHKLHWRDIISISTFVKSKPFVKKTPEKTTNNASDENLKKKNQKQSHKEQNTFIRGNDIPDYVTGKIHVLLKYKGQKKNFVDILVVEKEDDMTSTYGPIRLFEQNSIDVINDIGEGKDSFSDFSLSVRNATNNKYYPIGRVLS